MPEQTPIPELPDRAIVMVGRDGEERVYLRDDRGLEVGDDCQWWLVDGTQPVVGYRWSEVEAYGNVVRLFRPEEVAQAVAEAQLVPLGTHLKEPGGWCRSCSIQHSEPEWARIHDQLAEEDAVVRRIGEEDEPC